MARAKKTKEEMVAAVMKGTEGLPEMEAFAAAGMTAPATTAPATVEVRDLGELVKEVTTDQVGERLVAINTAFDARVTYERTAQPGNDSIQDRLKSYRKKMALPGIAALLVATNVDPEFINRTITEGKRFNIYAIDKVNDLLHGLNSGTFRNAINQAVMKSLFKFRKAGVPFTGLAAIAAVSDKVKCDKALTANLVRHTVSAATAPTQASSTMNALQVLGVVTNKGSAKFPIWELQETPVTKAIEKLLAA